MAPETRHVGVLLAIYWIKPDLILMLSAGVAALLIEAFA